MRTSETFECLGVPVRADETRSAAVCRNGDGLERVVIAARGYVLIVDPISGQCRQVPFPKGRVDYPFACMSARSGLFYTGAGRMLMALDPFAGEFVWWSRELSAPEEQIWGMAFAEAEDGMIYATTYPGCKLFRIDPATGGCNLAVQLDSQQKYAMTLAADREGWIYAGIGTTEAMICGWQPGSGSSLNLFPEQPKVIGNGQVHRGTDGEVYAFLPPIEGEAIRQEDALPRWFRLIACRAEPVQPDEVAPAYYRGIGYQKLHGELSGGRRICSFQLAEGELVIEESDGRITVLPLHYEGGGTELSPMTAGPDGSLYGTSNHPMHLYRYDPIQQTLVNFGGKAAEKGGGGNICAYAAQGPYLVGAAYAGGMVYLLDTRVEPCAEPGDRRNPKLLHADERIHRPRSALAHPDGTHVLYGGFPQYGAVGGGLGIVDIGTATYTLYSHEQIIPWQSTLGLAVLSTGDVIGATSVETPGGADPVACEAVLYLFHWQDRLVTRRWVPIPEAKEISLIASDSKDYIYGLTSESVYFVYDPVRECLLYRADLSGWGGIVRQGLVTVGQGSEINIFGLLSRALFRISPDSFEPELLSIPPKEATSGLAFIDGSLYFGCGSELWRFMLPN